MTLGGGAAQSEAITRIRFLVSRRCGRPWLVRGAEHVSYELPDPVARPLVIARLVRDQSPLLIDNECLRNEQSPLRLRNVRFRMSSHWAMPERSARSEILIPRTIRPCELNCWCRPSRDGISLTQGEHQVAQRLTRRTLPLNSRTLTGRDECTSGYEKSWTALNLQYGISPAARTNSRSAVSSAASADWTATAMEVRRPCPAVARNARRCITR